MLNCRTNFNQWESIHYWQSLSSLVGSALTCLRRKDGRIQKGFDWVFIWCHRNSYCIGITQKKNRDRPFFFFLPKKKSQKPKQSHSSTVINPNREKLLSKMVFEIISSLIVHGVGHPQEIEPTPLPMPYPLKNSTFAST